MPESLKRREAEVEQGWEDPAAFNDEEAALKLQYAEWGCLSLACLWFGLHLRLQCSKRCQRCGSPMGLGCCGGRCDVSLRTQSRPNDLVSSVFAQVLLVERLEMLWKVTATEKRMKIKRRLQKTGATLQEMKLTWSRTRMTSLASDMSRAPKNVTGFMKRMDGKRITLSFATWHIAKHSQPTLR